MIRIYLLRHGQTEFNVDEIVQGWNDSPLTTLGIYQATCTGYGLKDTKFEKIYSGDLLRQINTAKAFISNNSYKPEIITDYHFREMNYGKYQDNKYRNMLEPLFKMFNDTYGGYEKLYKYMNDMEIADEIARRDETKQTEGTIKLWQRFKEGLDIIINENKKGNILVSTSSIAIYCVLYNLFPDLKQNGLVDNASISIIEYDNGKYKLIDYNNIEYRKIGEQHLM